MIETELKNCPLCGGSPIKSSEGGSDERNGYAITKTIRCRDCGLSISRSGDSSKGGYADNSHVDKDVVTAWNTRPSTPASVSEAAVAETMEPVAYTDAFELESLEKTDNGDALMFKKSVAEKIAQGGLIPLYTRPPARRETWEEAAKVEALKAYEAWEADLVVNGDWSGGTVRMTQAQHDRMIEIQAMRHAALRATEERDDG